MIQPRLLTPIWFRSLVITLLILGIFFRFVNLERKVYWCDETYTSLRISGYTAEDFFQQAFNRKIIDVKYLDKYQYPNDEKGVIDTIRGLATEEPQHSPFYYVMLKLWVQLFGDSVTIIRSLSALISLLAFPGIYWLCLELFNLPLVGWMAIALLSISPFHLLYAQEAREYSLWIVTVLFSSAAFLRAVRKQTKQSWVIYAIALALNFYSFFFSIWMTIGHGIYLLLLNGFRWSWVIISYLFACTTALILFAPWLLTIINSYQVYTTTTTVQTSLPFWDLLKAWGRNLCFIFIDGQAFLTEGFSENHPSSIYEPLAYLIPLVLILVSYAIYFICHQSSKRIWLFILTLVVSAALPLVLVDICLGWRLSTIIRYLVPCCLGIQIAVAYLLITKITTNNLQQQKFWRAVMLILIFAGVLSGAVSSQSESLLTKGGYYNYQIAHLINQASRPLFISYSSAMCDILSISHRLDKKTKILLFPNFPGTKLSIPDMSDTFSNIFLFDPSNIKFQYGTENQTKSQPKIVYQVDTLRVWELGKK